MRRKVYIFSGASRAAAYGIGTYTEQLISCLRGTDIEFELVFLNSGGKEITVNEKKDYRQISIPAVNSSNTRSLEYYSRNVAYILKDFIPDDKNVQYIFHLNFMTNPTLVQNLKKLFKCKIIAVVHYTNWSFSLLGDEKQLLCIWNKKKKDLSFIEKQIVTDLNVDITMIKKCDKLVCVARHTLDTFLKISDINISKCRIINNALEDEYKEIAIDKKSDLRRKWRISESTKIILFVGRLDKVKGGAFLIRALEKVLQTNPDTHLIIAGDGDYTGWLQEANYYWTKITFTGRLDKKKVFELYQMANVGVVSSLHEEFGYVAVEMMMHQLPIVVTDTGGLSEIVEDNVSGLKVPVQKKKEERIIDTNKLSDKINLLLDDPEFANKIAEGGRTRFLQKYEISAFKEKMIALYKEI